MLRQILREPPERGLLIHAAVPHGHTVHVRGPQQVAQEVVRRLEAVGAVGRPEVGRGHAAGPEPVPPVGALLQPAPRLELLIGVDLGRRAVHIHSRQRGAHADARVEGHLVVPPEERTLAAHVGATLRAHVVGAPHVRRVLAQHHAAQRRAPMQAHGRVGAAVPLGDGRDLQLGHHLHRHRGDPQRGHGRIRHGEVLDDLSARGRDHDAERPERRVLPYDRRGRAVEHREEGVGDRRVRESCHACVLYPDRTAAP